MNFYFYKAKVERVIDGDTIVCHIDLGFDMWIHHEHVRLYGINTPEVRTKDVIEKAAGLEAKSYVENFLKLYDNKVILETVFDRGGKYGRTLAKVYVEDFDTGNLVELNEKLINEGLAIAYH